ncbi:hypothetical protein [Rhodoplanes sp. Z2-YC6860]|uniref:hypothetical protein n=1 Tax=Rhodoplanes sp. Z2-YC6860 TaxID=674703 RepID=UPI00078D9F42|nr:hypothetical protein [Rhodoplanes sp. Z2-YC6860]AMN44354.1 hypothetical protein RHPLAN_59430 [Rhodoplanes sp. Z2-YC6860]
MRPSARLWPGLRAASLNALITLIAIIAGYLIIELIFFRVFLPNVELQSRPHLPETAGVLLQRSKAGFVPQNYVAVLGDSYAEGLGNWLLKNGGNEALPFGSVDVLHAILRRDVVSFGRGGAGNAEGFVRQPARILAGSHCLIFPTIPEPDQIIAYFYEGNDIEDNLRFLQRVHQRFGKSDTTAIDQFLSTEYAHFSFWQCRLQLGDTISRMTRFLFAYRNLKLSDLTETLSGPNKVIVGQAELDVPLVEAPPMQLDDDDIRKGLAVFERSLLWLRHRFPAISITVVYIPAPLTVYRKANPTVHYRYETNDELFTSTAGSAALERKSDQMCSWVRDMTTKAGARFLDSRPAARAVAADNFIHGPDEWEHYNELGYRTLATFLAQALSRSGDSDRCSAQAPPTQAGP